MACSSNEMAEVLSRNYGSREWQCPYCTAVNSATDIDCRVCIKPKPGRSPLGSHLEEEQNQLPEEGPVKRSFVNSVKWLVLGKPAPWKCPKCTCEMGGYYTKCSVCGFLRTDIRRKSDSSVISDLLSVFRRSPDHKRKDTSVDQDLDSGFQDGKSDSGWNCTQCTLRNDEKAKVCSACTMEKPSKQKKDSKKKKTTNTGLFESYAMIDADELGVRVTPPSREEPLTDSISTVQDENNLSENHYPLDPDPYEPVSTDGEGSALVLPTTSPQHASLPPQLHPSSSSSTDNQPKIRTAVLTDPSWKCSVCGAFNLIFALNQKCFVCGIGQIPPETDHDIVVLNNGTHLQPSSLVVPSYPIVPRSANHGQLVYTQHSNTVPVSGADHNTHINNLPSKPVQPQRPKRLTPETKQDQSTGGGRRRGYSSNRRSLEDSLGTPVGRTTTMLTKVVKRQYVEEADRTYKEICQYCQKVGVSYCVLWLTRKG